MSGYEIFDFFGRPTSVEVWKPGMGLNCSHMDSSNRKSFECGPPVARVTTRPTTYVSRSGVKSRAGSNYILCLNHLTNLTLSYSTRSKGKNLGAEATKRAKEKLIVDHWREYQALIDQYTEEIALETLQSLPGDLQAAVLEHHNKQENPAK